MLRKFISIKNVGRFLNYGASGDVELRRYNLIFAENGRGKTTLCAILRSLFTNTPALVIGRRTLGSMEPPEVQVLLENGSTTFRNGAWSAAFPDMAVFDGTYVSENVFAGDVVDTDNRRNLYRVIIGSPGVTLAERLNDLDGRVRTKTTEIRDNRARIEHHLAGGMTVQAFIALPEDGAIDARIAAKEQDLQAVRRSEQIQQRPPLAGIPVPVFPPSFATLLAKTLENVAADAEQSVAEHVRSHRMGARGEPWLTEGLEYIAADSCPFCGQVLTQIDLIQAYRRLFSREYHALRQEATDLGAQIERAIGDRVGAGMVIQVVLQNNGGVEFWQQYCTLAPPIPPEVGGASHVLTALREAAQTLLLIKSGKPLEAVPPDDRYAAALGAFEALRASLAAYNAAVAAVNAVIHARKRETLAANVGEAESELARLKGTEGASHRGECGHFARLTKACMARSWLSRMRKHRYVCNSTRTRSASLRSTAKASTAIWSESTRGFGSRCRRTPIVEAFRVRAISS